MEKALASLRPQILDIFNHLHANPEASWAEYNTTKYLQEILQREGYKIITFPENTGVVGEKGTGKFAVGLRADIDAVWQEVDGRWQANHSCGHDAHMTIVLGTVMLLNRLGVEFPGLFKVIFQPAEESGNGALKLIELGVIEGLDYLYGVHLRPLQELPGGAAAPATLHGAAKFIQGELKGVAAHAGRPHLGVNTIEVGAALVQALAQIHTDPQIPASIKMTRFTAGDEYSNVIPGRAEFAIDLRSQSNDTMSEMVEKCQKVFQGVSETYGADIVWNFGAETVAAVFNAEAAGLMNSAIIKSLGPENTRPPITTSGGEDFHHYAKHRQGLKATMLGLGCNLAPGLHHPEMSFDHEAIFTGIKIMATAVIDTFAQHHGERDGK